MVMSRTEEFDYDAAILVTAIALAGAVLLERSSRKTTTAIVEKVG